MIANKCFVFTTLGLMWAVPTRGYIKRTPIELQSLERQAVKRRLGGWCEMAARLRICQLKHRENCEGVWREDLIGTANTEAEESPLLRSITRKRLVKTVKTLCVL
jgi:hypothetical protein